MGETRVDDFYFSALFDEDEIFPISDEKYAQELQMQEALYSSASSRIVVEKDDKEAKEGERETGESSSSFCMICMDSKQSQEMFRNNPCRHLFCTACMSLYVASKLQENTASVKCPDPGCKRVIDPETCQPFIPKQVFERWENALCESLILSAHKFYCPFKDCSVLMVDDSGETMSVSECPSCRRLFCAQCKVAWHAGLECGEFQGLSKDDRAREDVMMVELAKKKEWMRCPNCKYFIEKVDGCQHISCRCGYHFCYGCGLKHSGDHVCRRTA